MIWHNVTVSVMFAAAANHPGKLLAAGLASLVAAYEVGWNSHKEREMRLRQIMANDLRHSTVAKYTQYLKNQDSAILVESAVFTGDSIPMRAERLSLDARLDRMRAKGLRVDRMLDSGYFSEVDEEETAEQFCARVMKRVKEFEKAEGLDEFRLVRE